MTDRYEHIRAALAMGPTPGPWKVGDQNGHCGISIGSDDALVATAYLRLITSRAAWGEEHFAMPENQESVANAALIAACDPDTIRKLLAERDQLAADLEAAREDVSIARRALLWLASGDSGASSKAICYHMLGMKSDGSFPRDPSDLGRCLRLLELFPEWKPRIGEMARYSPYWAALVARWDEIAEMMADEVGIDWSKGKRAPRTYAAMEDAIDQARGKGGKEDSND